MEKDIEDDNLLPTNEWRPGVSGIPKKTAKYVYGAGIPYLKPGGSFHSPWNNPLNHDVPDGVGAPTSFHRVVVNNTTKAPLTGLVSISGTGGHVCALQNTGRVYCWGNNNSGQLGRNNICPVFSTTGVQQLTGDCRKNDVAMPVIDDTGSTVTNAQKVVATSNKTYILTTDGKLLAMGRQNPTTGANLGFGLSLIHI